jgi:hypothetical protein
VVASNCAFTLFSSARASDSVTPAANVAVKRKTETRAIKDMSSANKDFLRILYPPLSRG